MPRHRSRISRSQNQKRSRRSRRRTRSGSKRLRYRSAADVKSELLRSIIEFVEKHGLTGQGVPEQHMWKTCPEQDVVGMQEFIPEGYFVKRVKLLLDNDKFIREINKGAGLQHGEKPVDIPSTSPLIENIQNLGEIRKSGIEDLRWLGRVTSQFLFIPLDVRCRTNQYIVINRPTVIVPYDADLEFCRETLKYLPQNAEWSRAFIKAFMLLVRVERSQLEPDDKRHLQTLFSKLNVMNGAFTDRLVESLGTA